MSDESTIRMIRVYNQTAAPTMFLSGFFVVRPGNLHTSEEVEVDIVRSDEDISIVIQDLSTSYRMNSSDLFVNKKFTPPIHKEALPLNSHDLIKRMPGANPFQSPDFRANVISLLFDGMVKVERKIRRSMELQASQVLQTGIVTLTNSAGVALYVLDYKPKSSHFPTVGNAWGAAGETPIQDLESLSEVIRNDGLSDPNQLIFGVEAFEDFIKSPGVLTRFDNRRIDLGSITPMVEVGGEGGRFRGTVDIGNYKFDVWTYPGRFKDPQTGNKVQFVSPSKVIMRDSLARLDATFGAIPNIGIALGAQRTALLPEFPGRFNNAAGGMDLFTNAWLSPDGEQLFGGVGARPLMIPTAIDAFGCLETNV